MCVVAAVTGLVYMCLLHTDYTSLTLSGSNWELKDHVMCQSLLNHSTNILQLKH